MTDTTEALRLHLGNIERQWDDLLDPAKVIAGERVDGSHDAPLPISVGILSLRREACEKLGSWVQLVYEERDLSTTGHNLNSAKESCAFLTIHADWLARHVAAADALGEVAQLDQRITTIVTGNHVRRFVVGPCPEDDCVGELVALIRTTDSLLPSELRCTKSRDHTWAAHTWRSLGDRLHGPTINEVAARRFLNTIAG